METASFLLRALGIVCFGLAMFEIKTRGIDFVGAGLFLWCLGTLLAK